MAVPESPHYQVLKALAAAFPHSKVELETILTYAVFLADVSVEDLRRGAAWCMANSDFFPTMHTLREAIQQADLEHRPPTGPDALAEIKRKIGAIGYYGTPEWSHPLIGRAVEGMGGWRALCLSEDPEGVIRGQFLKVYASLEERVSSDERAALTADARSWKQITALAGKLALPGSREGK